MDFISVTYLAFLCVVLILFYKIPKNRQWILLLVSGIIFYSCFSLKMWIFLLLYRGKYGMINMYIGSMRQPFSMDNGQLSIPNGPPGAKALQIMAPLKTGTAETFPGAGSQRF